MEANTKEILKMTPVRDMVLNVGETVQNTKVNISMVWNTELENLRGLIKVFIMGSFLKIKCKVKGKIYGLMEGNILEIGIIIWWTAKVSSLFKMVESTPAATKTIKNMVTVFSNGQTEENTRVDGLKDINMERVL